jgi:glycerophosphoryl diester phosphodiesterase
MGISSLTAENNVKQNLHWGGGYALWDICWNKVIGLPVLELLYSKADDTNLRDMIKAGIDRITVPRIEKIQEFLKKRDCHTPQCLIGGDLTIRKSLWQLWKY